MAKVSTRADMALIKGAADVGKSMAPADLSGLDKVTKAGTDMAVSALGEIQKIEQEKVDAFDAFTEAANEVELNSGALGEVLYNDTVDFAQEAKNNYLAAIKAGDQKGMMAAKKAMQQRSAFTQQHKAFITELSELQKEGDLSGAMDADETAFMTRVLKGEYKVEKNEKGEMVFNVDGVKKTNTEFEDLYILKNYEVGKTLGELNAKVVKEPTFNRDNVKNTLIQVIPKTVKDFRAALHDDLGGGQGFKELLVQDESLEEEIKMALGDAGWEMYSGGDNVMDANEKALFIKAITDHKDPNFNLETSREIMAEKMTNVVGNKYDAFQKDAAKVAEAKRKQEIADKAEDFRQKKILKQMDINAKKIMNKEARKDIVLNQTLTKFADLNTGRFATDDEGTYNIVKRALANNDTAALKQATENEINFFRRFVDPGADVRHLNKDELAEYGIEPGEINTEGAYPNQGYYRMKETGVDEKTGAITYEPELISSGYELDINSIRGLINFDMFGIEGATNPYTQNKTQGKYNITKK